MTLLATITITRGAIVGFRPGERFGLLRINYLPVSTQVLEAIHQIRYVSDDNYVKLEGMKFARPDNTHENDVALMPTRFYVLAPAPDEADYLERMYAAEADL